MDWRQQGQTAKYPDFFGQIQSLSALSLLVEQLSDNQVGLVAVKRVVQNRFTGGYGQDSSKNTKIITTIGVNKDNSKITAT